MDVDDERRIVPLPRLTWFAISRQSNRRALIPCGVDLEGEAVSTALKLSIEPRVGVTIVRCPGESDLASGDALADGLRGVLGEAGVALAVVTVLDSSGIAALVV